MNKANLICLHDALRRIGVNKPTIAAAVQCLKHDDVGRMVNLVRPHRAQLRGDIGWLQSFVPVVGASETWRELKNYDVQEVTNIDGDNIYTHVSVWDRRDVCVEDYHTVNDVTVGEYRSWHANFVRAETINYDNHGNRTGIATASNDKGEVYSRHYYETENMTTREHLVVVDVKGVVVRHGRDLRVIQRHSLAVKRRPEGIEINTGVVGTYSTRLTWGDEHECVATFQTRELMYRWMLRHCIKYTPYQTVTEQDVQRWAQNNIRSVAYFITLAYRAGYNEAKRTAWATK